MLAVIAGTDLLCLGRDQDQPTFLAVQDGAHRGGAVGPAAWRAAGGRRGPGRRAARLDRAGGWTTQRRAWRRPASTCWRRQADACWRRQAEPPGERRSEPDRAGRRAAGRSRLTGALPALHRPLVVQLVPPSNLAVGAVPWGLGCVRAGRQLPGGQHRDARRQTWPAWCRRLLAAAVGRSLIIVVRDAHRYPVASGSDGNARWPPGRTRSCGDGPAGLAARGGQLRRQLRGGPQQRRAAAEILGLAASSESGHRGDLRG